MEQHAASLGGQSAPDVEDPTILSLPEARALLARSPLLTRSANDDEDIVRQTVTLARHLWLAAENATDREERSRHRRLARLMDDPHGQAFTLLLTDRAFRSPDPRHLTTALGHLVRQLGPPAYLTAMERGQLRLAAALDGLLPRTIAAGVRHRIRQESQHVLVHAGDDALKAFLAGRQHQGVRVNINYLGEEVLSEQEATARRAAYANLLRRPDVEAISIKASSICSRVDLLAYPHTVERLKHHLAPLYELALAHPFQRADGSASPKLVYLDMESYDDLELTATVFCALLEETRFRSLTAGIALQAYLPDAFPLQQRLTRWAQERLAQGGAPIRVRIVKGANLAQEQVQASQRGWELPTYGDKAAVDANYRRMVTFGCEPQHAQAVHLGVASHNVFDLALTLLLRARNRVEPYVGLELLHGMAEPLRRATMALCDNVLIYAPLVEEAHFDQALSYLVRRLDENTSPDNFLRHSFGMRVDDPAFQHQRQLFDTSFRSRNLTDTTPRNPPRPACAAKVHFADLGDFQNEPDTMYRLAIERQRTSEAVESVLQRPAPHLPLYIGGEAAQGATVQTGFDPSRPQAAPYTFELASEAQLGQQLATATRAQSAVAQAGASARGELLKAVAAALRDQRHELIALMAIDGGKRFDEGDAEVSEAIDFAEYYRLSFHALTQRAGMRARPRGVTLITPPWNFPLAITAGGVLAALQAGNAVLLKPPLETYWVGYRFAQLCWDAGVPRNWLQVCPCTDTLGSRLIRDPQVAQVILTGSDATARVFQELRPGLRLFAETGGKNAIIATAQCDEDRLIADVLHSAFGHAGQKCSAASLLICEATLYDRPGFLDRLAEAAATLPVGSALEPHNLVTPLIRPPAGALRQALDQPQADTRWLLSPKLAPDNPRLLSPGIKVGVQPGAHEHRHELFGPVLAVMRAQGLKRAIEVANDTPYGLTSGLHSLDADEQRQWLHTIQAGNQYLNRGITGAIVRRQPFGGWKASSVGPGAKAGGPNYVAQLCDWQVEEVDSPSAADPSTALNPAVDQLLSQARTWLSAEEQQRAQVCAADYAGTWATELSRAQDPSQVRGELNLFGYVPLAPLVVRLEANGAPFDALLACCAALTCEAGFSLSVTQDAMDHAPWLQGLSSVPFKLETSAELEGRLETLAAIRLIGTAPEPLARAAESNGLRFSTERVLRAGRLELLHYLKERSISARYHRYGNLAAGQPQWLDLLGSASARR